MQNESSSSSSKADSSNVKVGRLPELEGLRGLLAWWVVGTHLLGAFGYEAERFPGFLGVLLTGNLRVNVFIIMSGFVISLLLNERKESYRDFLVRRWCRIYPLFLVCLLLAAAAVPLVRERLILNQHYYPSAGFIGLLAGREAPIHHFWPHFLAHLFLVHGLIPDQVMMKASATFLPPAWTISLEWQFYLLAPLVVFLLRSRPGILLTYVGVFIMLVIRRYIPTDTFGAFLPFHAEYFFVGMMSYLAMRRLVSRPEPKDLFRWLPEIILGGVALFVPIAFFTGKQTSIDGRTLLPLLLWGVVWASMAIRKVGATSPIATAVSRFLCSRPMSFLGSISYSTYLIHFLVIHLADYCLCVLMHAERLSRFSHLLLLSAISIPLIALLSWGLYHGIESPGMRLSRYLIPQKR